MGYTHAHEFSKIEPADNVYQWAIVSKTVDPAYKKVIGWFAYKIQPETDTAYNFGLYSFDKGNPLIGKDVFQKMDELVQIHRRVEWRAIGGNPAIKNYDRFCIAHKGNKVTLHDVVKAPDGSYRDEHIYEIYQDKEKEE